MTKITTENRADIQEQYIAELINSMDIKTLAQYAYDSLNEAKAVMTNDELEREILHHTPYILENN